MYSLDDLLRFYNRRGLKSTILRSLTEILSFLYAFLFFFSDRLLQNDKRVCLITQESHIDSDIFSLMKQLSDRDYRDVYLCVESEKKCREENNILLKDLSDVEVIERNTINFVYNLSRSYVCFEKNTRPFKKYILSGSPKTRFITIFHGIVIKGRPEKDTGSFSPLGFNISMKISKNNNPKSVASNLEKYMRGYTEDSVFKQYGYPRFDRVKKLANNNNNKLSVISEEYNDEAGGDNDYYRILYAPTHKKLKYKTEIFPFENINYKELYEFLHENKIRIFIRMHPMEKELGLEKSIVDEKTIYSADERFSGPTTEVLPHFDALITDYSSIYLEFLEFDRPIIFVKDNHEEFEKLFGFSYDYNTFFPGKKVDDFHEFLSHLSIISQTQTDGFKDQRKLVQQLLLSAHQQNTFLEAFENDYPERTIVTPRTNQAELN